VKSTQKMGQLEASILQEEQTINSLERRFNSTRSFDALKKLRTRKYSFTRKRKRYGNYQ